MGPVQQINDCMVRHEENGQKLTDDISKVYAWMKIEFLQNCFSGSK